MTEIIKWTKQKTKSAIITVISGDNLLVRQDLETETRHKNSRGKGKKKN